MTSKPIALLTHDFGETEESASIEIIHEMNVSIAGTFSATIVLQRSFDGGSTWRIVKTWTAVTEEVLSEPERGVLYRFACTVYASGTASCRLAR